MRYYFITGTSRGIGKSLALELLQEKDSKVFGIARNLSIHNGNYVHFHIDLSDLKAVDEFRFPDIKSADEIVLVNNAGTLGEVAHSGNLSESKIIAAYNVNLITPAILINKFIAKYRELNAKKVVLNISSGAAQRPVDGWSIYCSSKAGLDMLSKTVQQECNIDKSGFKIFSVAPGIVDTAMQDKIRTVSKKDFSTVETFKGYKEYGELQHPEVVARKLVYFLERSSEFTEVVLSLKSAF